MTGPLQYTSAPKAFKVADFRFLLFLYLPNCQTRSGPSQRSSGSQASIVAQPGKVGGNGLKIQKVKIKEISNHQNNVQLNSVFGLLYLDVIKEEVKNLSVIRIVAIDLIVLLKISFLIFLTILLLHRLRHFISFFSISLV